MRERGSRARARVDIGDVVATDPEESFPGDVHLRGDDVPVGDRPWGSLVVGTDSEESSPRDFSVRVEDIRVGDRPGDTST